MSTVLIAGCGRLGKAVATKEQQAGNQVYAICRRNESVSDLNQAGIQAYAWDLDQTDSVQWPFDPGTDFDSLYYLVAPPAVGEQDTRVTYFLNVLQKYSHQLKQALLISTTGIYGDCHGEWVDELREPNPTAARAHRRLHAEKQFQQWTTEQSVNSVILRVPGIYSAARLPFARLKKMTPILQPDQAPYSNRIHEHDLSMIMFKAIHAGLGAEVFNVADDQPSTMSDYFIEIARCFNMPLPPTVTKSEALEIFSQEMMSYLSESRRISNHKVKKLLDYQLKYPTLQAGLLQCLAEINQEKHYE